MSSDPSTVEREKRFDWVNGFMTASLNAAVANANLRAHGLTFENLNGSYVATVLNKMSSITRFPRIHIDKEDLDYLFHLEAELWGVDCDQYVGFFQQNILGQQCGPLQTHLFANAFFLLERWLHALIPSRSRASSGRLGRRRYLFGKKSGVLTVRYKDCLGALCVPYNLVASNRVVMPARSQATTGNEWMLLRNVSVPNSLARFYRSVSKHGHFADIIESSLKSSWRKFLTHVPKRRRRLESRGLKVTWYDVLWMYSESVRYHPIWPSQASPRQPFYWNRSVRWCTSLMISGILCLVRKANPSLDLGNSWTKAMTTNPLLGRVFGNSRDAIMA